MSIWYEGMDATSEAQMQFERDHGSHAGFRPTVIDVETGIAITRCVDCGKEFREYPSRSEQSS